MRAPHGWRRGAGPGLLDGALFVRLSQAGVPSILIEAGGGSPPPAAAVDRVPVDPAAGTGTWAYEIGW